MRGKVAKALRRAARAAMPGAPERNIVEVNHHLKRYPWLVKTRTDGNGQQHIIDHGVREVHQLVNGPSVRGLYRQMKKDYHHA